MTTVQYRKDIDALRGIAVSLVVVFHAFPSLLPGGFIGVDVFFVISGYLITLIIKREITDNSFSFKNFYARRVRRLFPALASALLTTLVLGWLILFPDEFQQLGKHISKSAIFLQNFNLIKELGYFDASSHYKPLLHLWTLSIEEQYYLLWPALLVLIFRLKPSPIYILSALILLSFSLNLYFATNYKDEVFFHSASRFWELGIGSLLAFTHTSNLSKLARHALFLAGISLIFCSSFFLSSEHLFPYWYGLAPTLGAAAIIYSNIQFKHWGFLDKVGLISYPLYLWHWIAISFTYIYLGHPPSITTLLILISGSILASIFTTVYVEKLRYLKSRAVVPSLTICVLAIGLAGHIVRSNDGFTERSHLSYLGEHIIQFKREAPRDELCEKHLYTLDQQERLIDYCRKSASNHDQTIVIIGDSHAHVMFPGIEMIAEKHSYNAILLSNSSCPSLIGLKWGRNPKELDMCQRKIAQVYELLSRDKKITKVLIATRGPVYIHDETPGKQTLESVQAGLKNFDKNKEMTYENMEKSLTESFSAIDKIPHIKNTYYLLENPELDFLPKEAIVRPFDWFNISGNKNTVSRPLYELRMKEYFDITTRAASNSPNTKLIDVTEHLCDESRCYSFIENNFLYADDDHFSVFGSKYIANKIEKELF